jgi:hypothetical protein
MCTPIMLAVLTSSGRTIIVRKLVIDVFRTEDEDLTIGRQLKFQQLMRTSDVLVHLAEPILVLLNDAGLSS